MADARLVALDSHRLIRATGADARAFLQGQVSSDLRKLDPARAQISSYSNPKGRMLAVLHLLPLAEAIAIEVHATVAEATLARLRKFVMRSKVTLELLPGPAGAGLIGDGAGAWLERHGLPAPPAPLACATARGLLVVRRPGHEPRFSLHGETAALQPAADDGAWRRAELLAGVPTVFPETCEHFVPQMCNLEELGGVAFDKGCYTGQEIVARLHFLGTLKRRMFLCHSEQAPGGPGTPVYDAAGDGQAAGEIVDSVTAGEGHACAVVLQLAHAESEQLHAGAPGGPSLSRPTGFHA